MALFRWENGRFEYRDTVPNLDWLLTVRLNTMKMIMSAAQRSDDEKGSQKKEAAG